MMKQLYQYWREQPPLSQYCPSHTLSVCTRMPARTQNREAKLFRLGISI